MSRIPSIPENLRQQLANKGYSGTRVFEINRLPKFAIPRTRQYNMTTLALAAGSLFGLIYAKRRGLAYEGFAIALGSVFFFDYLHRRELDNTTQTSMLSSGTLEHELEKYPVFKEGFEVVNRELDEKISELIVEKARMTE